MKVYVVYECSYSYDFIVTGVFSDREKAVESIEEDGWYDYIRPSTNNTYAPLDEYGFGWFKKPRKRYEMMPQAWIKEFDVDVYIGIVEE